MASAKVLVAACAGAAAVIVVKALLKLKRSSVSGQDLEFYYWPARGRGEQIRLVLAEAGVSWKQDSFTLGDEKGMAAYFAECRKLGGNGTTNVPMLKIDGHYLTQSSAVLRYCARKFGLYPSDDDYYNSYIVDNLLAAAEDLRTENYKPMKMFGGTDAIKQNYIETVLPKHLANVARLLGEQEWLAGTFSVADLSWYDVLDVCERQVPGVLSKYPNLSAFHARVEARPNIAAWHATDKFKAALAFPAL